MTSQTWAVSVKAPDSSGFQLDNEMINQERKCGRKNGSPWGNRKDMSQGVHM